MHDASFLTLVELGADEVHALLKFDKLPLHHFKLLVTGWFGLFSSALHLDVKGEFLKVPIQSSEAGCIEAWSESYDIVRSRPLRLLTLNNIVIRIKQLR